MKYLIILSSLFILSFVYSCSEDDTSTSSNSNTSEDDTSTNDSTDGDSDEEDDSTDTISYTLTGKIQDGKCEAGADVYILTLDKNTLEQDGGYYRGQTDENGAYNIPAQIDVNVNPYVEAFVEAACDNEITNQTMPEKTYRALIYITAGEDNNANPPTTATVARIRQLFNDNSLMTYKDFNASRAQAEQEYMLLHGITGITTPFTNMSIEDDTDGGAALLAMNITHLQDNSTVAEQTAFLQEISDELVSNDGVPSGTLKNKIKTKSKDLNLRDIKNNYMSQYGVTTAPGFYRWTDDDGDGILNKDDPDSVVELLDRTPKAKKVINNQITSSTMFDTNDNKLFAFPIVIDTQTSFKYIIGNVSGDHISLRANNDMGDADIHNDTPGTELAYSSKIPQDFFDSTLKDDDENEYNIPNEFSARMDLTVESGEYWIIMICDDFCQPSTGSTVGIVPFGRNLHSVDGINWTGHGQSAPFFRSNKIKVVLTD